MRWPARSCARNVVAFLAFTSSTCGVRSAFREEVECGSQTNDEVPNDERVDWDVVTVAGLRNHRSVCEHAEGGHSNMGCSIGSNVVRALEADEQITGECRTGAEDNVVSAEMLCCHVASDRNNTVLGCSPPAVIS